MYKDDIIEPVPIDSSLFFDRSEESLSRYTLAAYLLLTGLLFVHHDDAPEERIDLPSDEELEILGVKGRGIERIRMGTLDFREFATASVDRIPPGLLPEISVSVNSSGDPREAARLVAMACSSEDELTRICALGSAIDFFLQDTIDIPGQVSWFLSNAREPETFELLALLLARVSPVAATGNLLTATIAPQATTAGLIAIHGTVLPTSQSNRPEWSVPPNGSLFSHIQAFRNDIYAAADYYRWEGGYTDYAREVAMTNLQSWLNSHSLQGVDVVAHSHGCNVAMGSTSIGANYNKMVLLSCPVHWHKYNLSSAQIAKGVISIRTKLDFVILMDRGGQRFPANTIQDVVLPFWFTSHSSTTKPGTWQSQNLDQYLL